MMPVYTRPMRNIVPNLVYSARGDEVALVAVEGKVICRDGVILTIDEAECLAAVATYPDQIGEQATEQFLRINGTNAHFMRESKL